MRLDANVRMIRALAAAALWIGAVAARGEGPTVHQQMAGFHREWVEAGRPASTPAADHAPEYGTVNSVINVHAYEFQASNSTDSILDDGNGYRYFGSASNSRYMAAPVQIPSGVVIDFVAISSCSDTFGDLVVGLYDNGTGGGGSGGGDNITLFHAPQGCHFAVGTKPDYLYTMNQGHPLYVVLHWAGDAFDGTTKFNNIQIEYRRVVSAAPASATFPDVPTSDFGFQHVEALFRSGITGGCGGGLYCPDAPVTRRQMAIFLAKALGLHWQF